MKLTAFSPYLKVKPLFLVLPLPTKRGCIINWSICCNLPGKYLRFVENFQGEKKASELNKLNTQDNKVRLQTFFGNFYLHFSCFDSLMVNHGYVTR